jgi:hypothetical protein
MLEKVCHFFKMDPFDTDPMIFQLSHIQEQPRFLNFLDDGASQCIHPSENVQHGSHVPENKSIEPFEPFENRSTTVESFSKPSSTVESFSAVESFGKRSPAVEPQRNEKRLKRKSILARASRLKKKEYVAELESEVARLREIERLYLTQNFPTSKDNGVILTKEFYELLDSGKVFQIKTTLHGVTKVHYVTPCCQSQVSQPTL